MKKINYLQYDKLRNNSLVALLLITASIALACLNAIILTGGVGVFVTDYVSIIVIGLANSIIMMTLYGYLYYQSSNSAKAVKNLIIIFTSILFTVLISIICMKYLSPYAVPLAIAAIIVALLVSRKVAAIVNFVTLLLILVSVAMIDFSVYGLTVFFLEAFIGCTVSVLGTYLVMFMIKKHYSRFKLMYGSLFAGTILAFCTLIFSLVISLDYEYFLAAYAFSIVGSVITVAGFSITLPFYEEIFDVWTSFKLAEACSMSRPLLRRLAIEAPGTFSHCIVVSNLAESCAIAIGENPNLAKAAGMYHDVGKLMNPEFFIENLDGRYNPHDDLIPEHSARMIISHCNAGYEMLKKEYLPEQVAIVAKEHHGTTLAGYFYNKAKSITDGNVDDTGFRYEGPRPSSKIAAIVMIADIVEAATRAKQPENIIELTKIIDNIISSKIQEGEFNDSELSFADLDEIKHAMTRVIPSMYHKRIDYQK